MSSTLSPRTSLCRYASQESRVRWDVAEVDPRFTLSCYERKINNKHVNADFTMVGWSPEVQLYHLSAYQSFLPPSAASVSAH